MNILSKYQLSSSSGLGLTVPWIYFHKPSVTSLNYEAVYRTAPATPGLLIRYICYFRQFYEISRTSCYYFYVISGHFQLFPQSYHSSKSIYSYTLPFPDIQTNFQPWMLIVWNQSWERMFPPFPQERMILIKNYTVLSGSVCFVLIYFLFALVALSFRI